MPKVALTAAVLALLSGVSAHAATTNYSSAIIFGDSLSDNGNLHALTSATIGTGVPPAPYYFEGRTSNGPVWADHIADDFAAKGLYSKNYAYAYGEAVTNVDTRFGDLQVPDLHAQIEAFKGSGTSGLLGHKPVATIWIASNDLFSAMQAAPASVPGAMVAAASAVAGGIEKLSEAGIDEFVVFNMVPVDKTPFFATLGTPEQAQLAAIGVAAFNATLDGLLAGFGGDTRISKIDIHKEMNKLIENPGAYGVSDVTNPCFIPTEAVPPCDDPGERAFWDPVHPSTEIYAAIAELVRQDIAPIPLPAPVLLLLAGMAALAAVGARRRRA